MHNTFVPQDAGDSPSCAASSSKRKLGVACDACRFRKVKCDRETRIDAGYSTCSNCADNLISCIHTTQAPKKRLGKRLRMLQEQNDPDAASCKNHSEDSTNNTRSNDLGQASAVPDLVTLFATVSPPEHTHRLAFDQDKAIPELAAELFATVPSDDPCLSGGDLANDDRRLSAALSTLHQSSSSPASVSQSSSRPTPESIAIASNAAFLDHQSFLSGVATLQKRSPFDRVVPKASDLNKVGFVGGLLGIASLDKPMLDVCTRAYFESIGSCIGFIRPEWYWPRYHAYFARYTGVSIHDRERSNDEPLSELLLIAVACRGCGITSFANRFELQNDLLQHYRRLIKDKDRLIQDSWDSIESVILMVEHVADGKATSPPDAMSSKGVFDVDVLSHEGLIRLTKKLQLHLARPFGKIMQNQDAVRHRIIFWVIYVYDAIRSEAGRSLPLIHDDEVSVSDDVPTAFREDFRVQFRDHFVRLARLCRSLTYKLLSPRAAQEGIRVKDIVEVLDALNSWQENLPPSLQWDFEDVLHIHGPQDPEHRIRRTFLRYLHLGQWLLLSYAIKDHSLKIDDKPDLHGIVIERLDTELELMLDRQVLVCDHGTLYGIIRLHPAMMQSWTITWSWWVLERMNSISLAEAQGRLASAKASQAFVRYQNAALTFINGIATCDSNPDTPQIVQALLDSLRSITGERSSARSMFDLL